MSKKFFFGVVVFFVVCLFFLFAFGVVRAAAVEVGPQHMPAMVVSEVRDAVPDERIVVTVNDKAIVGVDEVVVGAVGYVVDDEVQPS